MVLLTFEGKYGKLEFQETMAENKAIGKERVKISRKLDSQIQEALHSC